MSETIRVKDDTYEVLESLKRDDEPIDELLSRMIECREKSAREGAGFWTGTDAVEKAREAREAMKDGVGTDDAVR